MKTASAKRLQREFMVGDPRVHAEVSCCVVRLSSDTLNPEN